MCGCAVFLGRSLFPLLPVPPHFFARAQRNGVEPQSNALMGAATGGVGSHPPLPRTRSPNGTNWCVKLACTWWVNWPGKVSLTQSAVMLGLRVRGRGGWDPTAPVAAPKSAFLWGSTPFLCARAKKWGGTGSRSHNTLPNKTAHPYNPPTSTSPLQKSGEEHIVYRLVALTRMVEPPR